MNQFIRSNFIPSIARGYVDSISVGDFNGDGKADFLIGRIDIENPSAPASNLQAFIGDGRGGFTDVSNTLLQGDTTTNYVARTVVGDFNGDGIDDVFLIESGTDVEPYAGAQNKLFLSDAASGKLVNATSALPQKILFSHGASAGDTTGTGKLDILVNALMFGGNELWLNNGKGQFTTAGTSIMPRLTYLAPWDPAQTVAQTFTMSEFIDVNNDGFADMVLGGWYSSGGFTTSQVLLNDGKGNFTGSLPINLPGSGVQKETVVSIDAIDLNGDDLPDLVMSITNSDEGANYYQKAYLQLLVNDGNGRFRDETQLRLPQSTAVSESGGWYKHVSVVDFNHDGYQDIVAFTSGNTPVSVWLGDASGRFNDKIELPGGPRSGDVADVDNSGMYDLITRSQDYTGIDVWTNNLVNQHIYKAGFGGGELVGSAGNDTFIATHRGNHVFVGNGGRDTLKLAGTSASYAITKIADGFTVKGQTVDVTARGIDRIVFDETNGIAFDESAAKVFRLYTAAFDRTADKEGTGFWLAAMDNGVSLINIASSFIGSPEFEGMYGANSSNEHFVSLLYKHVLHRELDQAGSDFWVNGLDNGVSRARILTEFSESIENVAQVETIIATGVQYQV
ncbi:DUF4214 domain-containing protein [Pigmentiphaga aceris]|uniref:DUF4214 domain-containing protein n=1 Tax=Pigmentiphaga aceris TaxID=1940612 RepID=A0A5C0B1R9_9BURK|nr:FG-GAP-like repeat-containing protein [Pigmentiphaga aceris]QEI08658.1 DUF4214 domain-containing protein [Pigmentiphaga aceris]